MLNDAQKEFLDRVPLFKVSAHLGAAAYVTQTKYKDLITITETVFTTEDFTVDQSVSICDRGIPRIVEFFAFPKDLPPGHEPPLLAKFVTFEEKQQKIYENEFIIIERIDKVFFDYPLETDFKTTAKEIGHIGNIPLYAKTL